MDGKRYTTIKCYNYWIKETFDTMSNTNKIMERFLIKFHSDEVKEAFQLLELLVKELEIKTDPEMFEVHLVNAAIQAVENLNLLEGILKEQVRGTLTGSKLQRLYDKHSTDVGSQVLFD